MTLCDTGPALLAVDDAHWCDEASLRWLVYLARRVAPLPLAVLTARRLGEPTAAGGLLDELGALDGALGSRRRRSARRRPPCSRARRSARPGRALRARLPRGDGRHPFLLGELLGELAAEGAAPSGGARADAAAERVVSDVHAPARAPVPCRGGARARGRGARRRRRAAPCGRARRAAAVGRGGRGRRADAGAAPAPRAAAAFAHPLLRAAVEAELPTARLAAAHRLAGALLDAEPALADRAAAHLLACEPAGDTWVAHKLRAAGERATARGAPEAAVRLLERARREPCDEPALQLGARPRLSARWAGSARPRRCSSWPRGGPPGLSATRSRATSPRRSP